MSFDLNAYPLVSFATYTTLSGKSAVGFRIKDNESGSSHWVFYSNGGSSAWSVGSFPTAWTGNFNIVGSWKQYLQRNLFSEARNLIPELSRDLTVDRPARSRGRRLRVLRRAALRRTQFAKLLGLPAVRPPVRRIGLHIRPVHDLVRPRPGHAFAQRVNASDLVGCAEDHGPHVHPRPLPLCGVGLEEGRWQQHRHRLPGQGPARHLKSRLDLLLRGSRAHLDVHATDPAQGGRHGARRVGPRHAQSGRGRPPGAGPVQRLPVVVSDGPGTRATAR